MPSSAGVYHWASITPGPKYGRICGWFAGWWNTFAWYGDPASARRYRRLTYDQDLCNWCVELNFQSLWDDFLIIYSFNG